MINIKTYINDRLTLDDSGIRKFSITFMRWLMYNLLYLIITWVLCNIVIYLIYPNVYDILINVSKTLTWHLLKRRLPLFSYGKQLQISLRIILIVCSNFYYVICKYSKPNLYIINSSGFIKYVHVLWRISNLIYY